MKPLEPLINYNMSTPDTEGTNAGKPQRKKLIMPRVGKVKGKIPPMRVVNEQILAVAMEQEKTAGGVILHKGMVYSGPQFVVIGVGPGRLLQDGCRVPVCVEVGDYIMSAKVGIKIVVKNQEYLIFQEAHIEVIVKKDDYDPKDYEGMVNG